ncbi:MAG: hypothetical protein ACK5LS_11410 [Propioniciclava sp.]
MVIFLALVVFLIVLATRGTIGPFTWAGHSPEGAVAGPEREQRPSPEAILAQRFAEGEISSEEYLERLSLFQGT